jgi:hypothetical protein
MSPKVAKARKAYINVTKGLAVDFANARTAHFIGIFTGGPSSPYFTS